jgi:hypothetical protein
MTFATVTLRAAGAVADDALQQRATKNVGGIRQARGRSAGTQPEPQAKPANPVPVDRCYENIRAGMRDPFAELGIAA